MAWYCHGLHFAEKVIKDQSEKYKRIKRTSNFDGEEKPCEKAYGGEHLGGRANDVRVWYIDINTLDELIALRDEVENELIVGTA